MRVLIAVLAICVLISTSAMAADAPPGSVFRPIFGNTACRERIPCTDDPGSVPSEYYFLIANKCLTDNYGYTSADGFFDEKAGLGRNSCLTAKPGILPHGMGAQLTPRCCVLKLNNGECRLNCVIIPE